MPTKKKKSTKKKSSSSSKSGVNKRTGKLKPGYIFVKKGNGRTKKAKAKK